MGAVVPLLGAVLSAGSSLIGGKPKAPTYTQPKPPPNPQIDDATQSANLRQENRKRRGHAANRLVGNEEDERLVAQVRPKSGYGMSAT